MRTTLAAAGWRAAADAFTHVYEGYLLPLRMDEAALRAHAATGDLRLERSPLWLDADGAPLALAALGVRGERGWVGGFGVARRRRREGIGERLGEQLVEDARAAGLARLQLEVLVGNHGAAWLYGRLGFTPTRELILLERPASEPVRGGGGAYQLDAGLAIASLPDADACWQRERPALAAMAGLRALVVRGSGAVRGGLLYREHGGAIGVAHVFGEAGAAAELTAALAATYPGRAFALLNEPDGSDARAGLLAAGWRESGRQLEMALAL
jgi:GNAT superfamily N-acetyltransferase